MTLRSGIMGPTERDGTDRRTDVAIA